MIVAPASGRSKAGTLCAALSLAVLPGLACEGTKHAIFEPLGKQPASVVAPGAPMPDAATSPQTDAGHKHSVKPADPMEEDAGSLPTDPDLDATVTFVWTETLPGQGTCRVGRYAGSFFCQTASGLPVTGQIAFTLGGSAEEQHLSITEGSITGALLGSGLTGELDCIQNHFQAASVDGQSLGIGDPNNPFAVNFPMFNASLQGDYDDQALVIAGTFSMVNDAGDMCSGMFRVSAAP